MSKTETKEDVERLLEKEVPYIDLKPYSHNIVGITLSIAAKNFGKSYANALIDKYKLEELGWSKVYDEDSGQQDLKL